MPLRPEQTVRKVFAFAIACCIASVSYAQQAADSGTVLLQGAGVNCFKITILESGVNYAIDYNDVIADQTGKKTLAAMGWMMILSVTFDGPATILSDGEQIPGCGDGTYHRITGVLPQ